jgi:glutamyl-tRNA synthetase
MIQLFDIVDVNKSASAFNGEKLAWLNQRHMVSAPPSRLVATLRWHLEQEGIEAADDGQLEQIVLCLRERAKTLKEMAASSVFFFRAPAEFDEKAVKKHITPEILGLLAEITVEMAGLVPWSAPAIHELIAGCAAAKGMSLGKLAQPIRLAVCGGTVSPPIDATLAILGKAEALSRLARAQAAWAP